MKNFEALDKSFSELKEFLKERQLQTLEELNYWVNILKENDDEGFIDFIIPEISGQGVLQKLREECWKNLLREYDGDEDQAEDEWQLFLGKVAALETVVEGL